MEREVHVLFHRLTMEGLHALDPDGTAPLRLNRNEYFFHHPPAVSRILDAGDDEQGRRYAVPGAAEALQAELSAAFDIVPEGPSSLFLFHGAEDALLKILLWNATQPGLGGVVLPSLSWSNYRSLASGLGLQVETFPTLSTGSAFAHDFSALDALLSASSTRRTVILASPNNPTGHASPRAALERLCASHSRHTFVLDSVYDAFPSPLATLPAQYPNAIFVGSLSKFFGLPGLRLGYTVSASGVLPPAFRLTLGFNPRSIAAARAALDEREIYARNWENMREAARRLREGNRAKHLHLFPTDASFLLARVDESSSEKAHSIDTAALARASGALPKDFTHNGVRYLRFGLGPLEVERRIERFLDLAAEGLTAAT